MTPVCTAAPEAPRTARFTARAQIVAGACACGALSAFVFAVDPSRYAVYPQCAFHNATGLYCAGCGATRAVYALLHGRVLDALHDNALFVAALPVLLYFLARFTLAAWRADTWPTIQLEGGRPMKWAVALFVLMLAFTVVRNLPGPAFAWLRPL